MIVLEEASYRYPGAAAWALGPVSLELRPGEVVGVRGANESGKSTLCLVVSGLAPAAIGGELRGSVLVDGLATSELPPHELARRCGVLFDNPAVQLTGLHRTVYDEVAFGPCNLGLPEAEARARTGSALDVLGIGHLADRHPRRLSGGESQLVALAGLLALGPAYLALDEPASRLDAERSALVAGAIARVAGSGVGVLIAEHSEALLARLCTRVVDLSPAPDRGPGHPAGGRLAPIRDHSSGTHPAGPASPGTPRIALEAVSHRYPDGTLALDGVSLPIAPGEAVAVTGPTGSGKSTLIRHLNGLLRPTSGRVVLEGEDVRALRVAQLARTIGIAFQEPDRQLFCRTVRAEVRFGARDAQAAAGALDVLGLAGVADRHPYDLGYSRRKLVAIAGVLAMDTPVVVLDEPTTGQDRAGVERLVALMAGLRARGRTLVVVSHDERFVKATCDREVRLVAGRLA